MNAGYNIDAPFYLDSQETIIEVTIFNSEEFSKIWLERSNHLSYEKCFSGPAILNENITNLSKG